MKVFRLIEGADFDPEALKVIFAAFDAAWQEIAGDYDPENAAKIDQARLQLANSVLAVASNNGRDTEQLTRDALQMMALAYRPRA